MSVRRGYYLVLIAVCLPEKNRDECITEEPPNKCFQNQCQVLLSTSWTISYNAEQSLAFVSWSSYGQS
jgi:hypothetical protein